MGKRMKKVKRTMELIFTLIFAILACLTVWPFVASIAVFELDMKDHEYNWLILFISTVVTLAWCSGLVYFIRWV